MRGRGYSLHSPNIPLNGTLTLKAVGCLANIRLPLPINSVFIASALQPTKEKSRLTTNGRQQGQRSINLATTPFMRWDSSFFRLKRLPSGWRRKRATSSCQGADRFLANHRKVEQKSFCNAHELNSVSFCHHIKNAVLSWCDASIPLRRLFCD